jgi:hypothetical protein
MLGSYVSAALSARSLVLAPSLRRILYRRLHPARHRHFETLRRGRTGQYSLQSFDEHRCIFVHIPKTGGISVAKGLFGNLAGSHTKLRTYECVFSATEFSNYYKFSFVRNPWGRLYSAYSFLKQGGFGPQHVSWAGKHLARYPDFSSFVCGWISPASIYSLDLLIPQFEFLRLAVRPGVGVDFLGRFESIEKDFITVCAALGIERPLPRLNASSSHRDFRDAYTPAARRVVDKTYGRDIALFGYEFEDS